jgi:membrane protein implicated in regulation of membrane protease activity
MRLSQDFVPWAWAVFALVIAALELHVPGSYLIWVACAAGVTALATGLGDWSLSGQLAIFAVSVVVSCVAGYFVYRQTDAAAAPGTLLNRRDLELIGAAGTAGETFVNGQGKARIGDTVWLAEAREDIPAGTPVVVKAVKGTTLVVDPRPPDAQ